MKKIIILYLLVAGIIVGKAASTLYQGSLTVNHGSRIAELQRENNAMERRQLELSQNIDQATSIAAVSSLAEKEGFEPISVPLVVNPVSAVASNL